MSSIFAVWCYRVGKVTSTYYLATIDIRECLLADGVALRIDGETDLTGATVLGQLDLHLSTSELRMRAVTFPGAAIFNVGGACTLELSRSTFNAEMKMYNAEHGRKYRFEGARFALAPAIQVN
jgi:hypothetical protein